MTRLAVLLALLLTACPGGDTGSSTGAGGVSASGGAPTGTTAATSGVGEAATPEATPEPAKLTPAQPGLASVGLAYGDLAADPDRFIQAVQDFKDDPEAMVELLFVALIALGKDRKQGHHLLTHVLRPGEWKPFEGYLGDRRLSRGNEGLFGIFASKPEILASYCGATPKAAYTDGNLADCRVLFDREYSARTQGIREDRVTYYIDIGDGAPRPRPVKLRYQDGRWVVSSFSGLLTGVVAPEPTPAPGASAGDR